MVVIELLGNLEDGRSCVNFPPLSWSPFRATGFRNGERQEATSGHPPLAPCSPPSREMPGPVWAWGFQVCP